MKKEHKHEHSHNHTHAPGEKTYSTATVKDLPRSEVEIEAEIPADILERHYKKILKDVAAHADVPGFRAGKVPEDVAEKHAGEMAILEKAVREALDEAYPNIVRDKNIRAIGSPTIAVTKLARGNPLGFKARTAVMPDVKINDYKKVAAGVAQSAGGTGGADSAAVNDDEVNKVIEDMRRMLAHSGHDHTHDVSADAEKKDAEEILPEVNDEFAMKLGGFKGVDDLRAKIRENIQAEKTRETRDKRRAEIAEKILAATEVEVPAVLAESELESMIRRFKHDIEHSGMKFDEYMTQIKKTEDEIRAEWRPSAEKKAKMELALSHIAREEKIVPDEERVKKELEALMAGQKDVNRFEARMYIEHLLKNEAVFEFLEKQAK